MERPEDIVAESIGLLKELKSYSNATLELTSQGLKKAEYLASQSLISPEQFDAARQCEAKARTIDSRLSDYILAVDQGESPKLPYFADLL
ncbi:hypothetical protein JXB11_01425 [Candidatus Woesearchaeota archaeon]|nr:hypothetical protein [Candidatus Woesearchaeota archaeon]